MLTLVPWPGFDRKIQIACTLLNKDLLSTNHFLVVGRQVEIFCKSINKDLLRTHHIPAVGRQVEIPRRFRNRDLLRQGHFLIVGLRSRGIENSKGNLRKASVILHFNRILKDIQGRNSIFEENSKSKSKEGAVYT